MYQVALSIGPDQLLAVAKMLYAAMLRHGYTHVVEFHYLHHSPTGGPYTRMAEMGLQIAEAAKQTGIKLTIAPICYTQGGFGQSPKPRQCRFISQSLEAYQVLLEDTMSVLGDYPNAKLACGLHSLRAVSPEVAKAFGDFAPKGLPFHIHIAEQRQEVEDAKAYLGTTPIAWLLDNLPVSADYHLVHATHATIAEVNRLAKTGAAVVLCPSTEGNLGDGIFPLKAWQQAGGQWSIGTDSHVGLNPFEEIRLLDYGQRLTTHQRDTYLGDSSNDAGPYGYHMALSTGCRAMGDRPRQGLEVGQPFDVAVIDAQAPLVCASKPEHLLSTLVYTAGAEVMLGTMIDGQWVIKNQRHVQQEAIVCEFKQAIASLGIR